MPAIRPLFLLPAIAAAALASLAFALSVGSVDAGIGSLWSPPDGAGDLARQVILELRLPRALCAFAVGGALALAGALMQVLLRNPLGDPYILGISGGAAVAVLAGMLFGLPAAGLDGAAFGGALASMLLVFSLAHGDGAWSPTRLLLTGVVIAAGWGALIGCILAISPAARLPGMLFWLMGDLSDATTPAFPLAALAGGLLAALLMARALNLLARGDQQAAALGLEVPRVRLAVYALASLLTAAAVTVAGSVGFVGLVVPHMFRLMAGSDHRFLLPGSVLLGGSLLLLADTAARSLLAPRQLPVGVLTALLGVPLFLYLLNRAR